MSGIRSLQDVKGKKDDKDDKKNEMFSQSGGTSGTAVLRPVRDDQMNQIVGAARQQASGPVHDNICNLTLYRNGFIVQDGAFRASSDPANRAFIEALMNG